MKTPVVDRGANTAGPPPYRTQPGGPPKTWKKRKNPMKKCPIDYYLWSTAFREKTVIAAVRVWRHFFVGILQIFHCNDKRGGSPHRLSGVISSTQKSRKNRKNPKKCIFTQQTRHRVSTHKAVLKHLSNSFKGTDSVLSSVFPTAFFGFSAFHPSHISAMRARRNHDYHPGYVLLK